MNNELMKNLEKVISLEKTLMRDLTEEELEYIKDHDVNDFFFDVLGFDEDDLAVLNKIRQLISDYCTRPQLEDENNLFSNEVYDGSEPFVANENLRLHTYAVLKSILNEIGKKSIATDDLSNMVVANTKTKFDASDFDKPDKFEFNDNTIKDTVEENLNNRPVIEIDKVLPESSKKWLTGLEPDDILYAADRAADVMASTLLSKEDLDLSTYEFNMDEFISELVDQIKDVAISKYVQRIDNGETIEFNDEEIQSEVLEYLYDHNDKVKSINNKISALCHMKK